MHYAQFSLNATHIGSYNVLDFAYKQEDQKINRGACQTLIMSGFRYYYKIFGRIPLFDFTCQIPSTLVVKIFKDNIGNASTMWPTGPRPVLTPVAQTSFKTT